METLFSVVPAKLTPPILHGAILDRQRLSSQMELVSQCKITIVCAGAGYGKTTLLSNLNARYHPVVWYSLGHGDRDLSTFTTYLIEGIRHYRPDFGEPIVRRLAEKGKGATNPEAIADELVEELDRVALQQLYVVLDDYQWVDGSPAIRRMLDRLLTYLPSCHHLVIGTRRSTRLSSIPRLRMAGEVNDITEVDLRFTEEEIGDFFGEVCGLQVGGRDLRALADQTEGWVIGLQLAAQSVKAGRLKSAADAFISLGSNRMRLFEYMLEEVYRRQPVPVQRFLRDTSVLSMLSTELCDAVSHGADSVSMLSHIVVNNLFIVELDGGGWRYHHLFRDFLRQQAGRESGRLNALHRLAGSHYERVGDLVEATQHYLAGQHYQDAARLIAEVGQSMLSASRFDQLTHWIRQMPRDHLESNPTLLLLQAQVYDLRGHYDESIEWAERAAQAFAGKGDGIGLARVLCSRAYQVVWRAGRFEEADALYRRALDYLPPGNSRERADLLRCIGLIHLPAGNANDARDAYRQALRMYEELGDQEGLLATLVNPGTWVYWLRGEFASGLSSLSRALTLATEQGSRHRLSECLGGISVTLRYLDRCVEAREYGKRAIALSREIGAVQLEAHNLTFLGFAYMGRPSPDLEEAGRCLRESLELAEREGNDRIRISAMMGYVQLLRRMGDSRQAVEVGNRMLELARTSTDRWLINAALLAMAGALVGQDDDRAREILMQSRELFVRFPDKWSLTCADYWLAVLSSRSDSGRFAEFAEEALDLAEANGYGFWFLEEPDTAVDFLGRAIRLGIRSGYCRRLLDTIAAESEANEQTIAAEADCGRGDGRTSEPPGEFTLVEPPVPGSGGVIRPERRPAREAPPGALPALRVYCFGSMRVYVGDRLVREEEWQRKKVKGLLAYLATSRDYSATRDELVERFWGDYEPGAAFANLSRTIHALRRLLDPDVHDLRRGCLVSATGLVKLRSERVGFVDVQQYLQHAGSAQRAERQGDRALAEKEYEAAELLYTGDLLTNDPYEEWTLAKREELRNLHMAALERLSRSRMDSGDYESAISYLQRAVAEDPLREQLHQLLMQCLARTGRRRDALNQFMACRRTLKEDLQIEPLAGTQRLYDCLVAGESI